MLLRKVVSSKLEDWIANQCAPEACGGGERLEVEEAAWAKEAGDPAKSKSTWDRGSEDARGTCVEDTDTITVWVSVDCEVALDAAMVGI